MIPEEKVAAVTQALSETFGVTGFDDIRRLTRGNSTSRVFRIVVRGTPYLLKMVMRSDDATRHFACMRAAAEAGLAPDVLYTSAPDKIAITGYVETAPFHMADALARMPAVLRSLHALPPFPGVPHHINTTCMFLMHEGPARDGFLAMLRAGNVLSQADSQEFLDRYAQLAAVYPHHAPEMVSSHNDLFKPDNILFDGRRVLLVDWEAAFLNDRYADLAAVANMLVNNNEEERTFLHDYLGRPPDEYELARLFLMRQTAHIFYVMAFLLLGKSGPPLNLTENRPDLHDFQQRNWAGDVNLSEPGMKDLCGRVHWEHLLQDVRQPRFEEALRIVGGRRASA